MMSGSAIAQVPQNPGAVRFCGLMRTICVPSDKRQGFGLDIRAYSAGASGRTCTGLDNVVEVIRHRTIRRDGQAEQRHFRKSHAFQAHLEADIDGKEIGAKSRSIKHGPGFRSPAFFVSHGRPNRHELGRIYLSY